MQFIRSAILVMYPGIRQILFIDIRIWMLGDSDIDIDWRPAYVMFSLPFSPLVFFLISCRMMNEMVLVMRNIIEHGVVFQITQ